MKEHPIRIIGIDPGLRRTGWGVIEAEGTRLGFVAAGTVASAASDELCDRLRTLHEGLCAIFDAHAPMEAAIEEVFVNKDARATLKLGQARGAAMLVPAMRSLPVAEYAPNLVKKTVIGVGHGDKAQIRMMVKVLMPKAQFDTDDAADALAIAVTHAHHRKSRQLMAAARATA